MTLVINGKRAEVPAGLTVSGLLTQQQVKTPEQLSVAVNDAILKRRDLDTTLLNEGDQVELLYFMGGG